MFDSSLTLANAGTEKGEFNMTSICALFGTATFSTLTPSQFVQTLKRDGGGGGCSWHTALDIRLKPNVSEYGDRER